MQHLPFFQKSPNQAALLKMMYLHLAIKKHLLGYPQQIKVIIADIGTSDHGHMKEVTGCDLN